MEPVALGRHDDSLVARCSLGVAGVGSDRAAGDATRRAQDVVMSLDAQRRRRLGAHVRRRYDRRTTGARTARPAALGRHGELLAARRSLGVAGVGSDRAVLAMRHGEQRRGDVTRRTAAHTTRRARVSAIRPAHTRRSRWRSVDATTRSQIDARSPSPMSALREQSRRCDVKSRRRGDITTRTATHTTRRARASRHDQRTQDAISGARLKRRLARDSALARRRRCRL